MEKLGVNLGFFLVQLLNFLILAIILKVWALDPIVRMLNERKQKIAQGLEDARVAAEARANAEKEAEKIIAAAQVEGNKVLADLRGQVAALAIAAANKVLGEALDDKRQRTLIDEFFSGVRSGRVAVLEGEQA